MSLGESDTTEDFIDVTEAHPVAGTFKDRCKWWRMVHRLGYAIWHRQVSNDGVNWKDV